LTEQNNEYKEEASAAKERALQLEDEKKDLLSQMGNNADNIMAEDFAQKTAVVVAEGDNLVRFALFERTSRPRFNRSMSIFNFVCWFGNSL
jgi:hypothetical protein